MRKYWWNFSETDWKLQRLTNPTPATSQWDQFASPCAGDSCQSYQLPLSRPNLWLCVYEWDGPLSLTCGVDPNFRNNHQRNANLCASNKMPFFLLFFHHFSPIPLRIWRTWPMRRIFLTAFVVKMLFRQWAALFLTLPHGDFTKSLSGTL